MKPGVAGRLVASPADLPGRLTPAAGRHDDPRTDRVAVPSGPFEGKRQPRAAGGPIVEISQRYVLREDQEVDPSVVVEIARGESPGHAQDRPGGAGAGSRVDHPAAAGAHQELRR